MPFQIIRDDITRVEADAIVNTANPDPEVGGGTDWAVHAAAGPELLAARKKIGAIAIGESVATPAFGLPARHVLHTVSPAWVDGQHGEKALLRKAYDAALNLADGLGCASAAFPLMAAGTYGFPPDVALSVALGAFTDFLLDHKMQIKLVLFNAEAFDAAGALFDDLKSYVDERYVSERTEEEYRVDSVSNILSSEIARYSLGQHPKKETRKESIGAGAADFCEVPERPSLAEFLQKKEAGFSEYLQSLLAERGLRSSEVYRRAEISRQLFSRILNNRDARPTKNTVIQLAIGLQLDLPQTQKLLDTAGYTLTRSSKADIVVEYCIDHGLHNVTFINEMLYDCGLPLLTTGLGA